MTAGKLISENQSGFETDNSCMNQLLSIAHEIYHSLDNGLEVSGVVLNISKAFDELWHTRLDPQIKSTQNFAKSSLFNKILSKSRKPKVALNGQT